MEWNGEGWQSYLTQQRNKLRGGGEEDDGGGVGWSGVGWDELTKLFDIKTEQEVGGEMIIEEWGGVRWERLGGQNSLTQQRNQKWIGVGRR